MPDLLQFGHDHTQPDDKLPSNLLENDPALSSHDYSYDISHDQAQATQRVVLFDLKWSG
jgi:hypothetical protein